MGNNPSDFKKGNNHPVEQVSWNDAKEFINRLNRRSQETFRLPTEAEWEYACRSGGKDEKYAGSYTPDRVAWYGEKWDNGHHAVGQKQANGLDLVDMSGNVWEWVEDAYDKNAYSQHSKNNSKNTAGSDRVLRAAAIGAALRLACVVALPADDKHEKISLLTAI